MGSKKGLLETLKKPHKDTKIRGKAYEFVLKVIENPAQN